LIRRAIQRSERFSAIYDRLKTAPKLMIDGVERYELPDTCQYVLHDGLLYLADPITGQLRLTIVGTTLQKQHLTAAHSPAHYGRARMADDLRAYYWPKMAQDIQRFLKHCPECLRNKPANHKPHQENLLLIPVVSLDSRDCRDSRNQHVLVRTPVVPETIL
jgi:hypothetical protein